MEPGSPFQLHYFWHQMGDAALPPLSLPVAPWDLVIQQEVRARLDCDFQKEEHNQGSSCHRQPMPAIG